MSMQITLLGTGSPIPSPDRAGNATMVRAGNLTFLFDAGRGVVMRMSGARVLPIGLTAVLLTHLHSDHICDLNDVITTHWVMSPAPQPLTIIGPEQTQEVIDGIFAMLGPDIGYRIAHHDDLTEVPSLDVQESTGGVVFADEAEDVRILAVPTDHRPVEPTLGYRVEHGGKSVVIGGDGVPSAGLDELCKGATAYVQTVLRPDLVLAVPMPRFQDTVDYHSSVEQTAQTAARGGVEKLVLTHQIPTPLPGSQDEWIAQASPHFDGEIIWGEDLLTIAL
jgi:ribonuclease Z